MENMLFLEELQKDWILLKKWIATDLPMEHQQPDSELPIADKCSTRLSITLVPDILLEMGISQLTAPLKVRMLKLL